MKNIIITIFTITLLISACKKKEEVNVTENPTSAETSKSTLLISDSWVLSEYTINNESALDFFGVNGEITYNFQSNDSVYTNTKLGTVAYQLKVDTIVIGKNTYAIDEFVDQKMQLSAFTKASDVIKGVQTTTKELLPIKMVFVKK